MEFESETFTRTKVCDSEVSNERKVLYEVETATYPEQYPDFELLSRRLTVDEDDTYFMEWPTNLFPEEVVYAALEDRFERNDWLKIREADLDDNTYFRERRIAHFTEADETLEEQATLNRLNVTKGMEDEFVILSYMRDYSPALFLASGQPENLNPSVYHDSERSGILDSEFRTLADSALKAVEDHELGHI